MKKKILKILSVLAVIIALTLLSACGFVSDYAPRDGENVVASEYENELKNFLAVNDGNRSSQTEEAEEDGSDGEKIAAEYLSARLDQLTVPGLAMTKKFTLTTPYDTFNSQNIVVSIPAGGGHSGDARKIIIGCAYDNSYESVKVKPQYSQQSLLFGSLSSRDSYYIVGHDSEGAVESGTSVATLLLLARDIYEARENLAFDVDIVFYGAGALNNIGAEKYYESVSNEEIALAVNLNRLGGEHVITYFDEVPTEHGSYIMQKVDSLGLSDRVHESTRASVKYSSQIDGLAYTPSEIRNCSLTYFGKENIMSITSGADQNYFTLYEREHSEFDGNIAATESDSLSNLSSRNENYAVQMYSVSALLKNLVTDPGLRSACENSFVSRFDYSFINSGLYLDIIVAGFIIVFAVIAVLVTKHFEKKYPFDNNITRKKIRVAVFGDEFETQEPEKRTGEDAPNPFEELSGDKKDKN